MKSTGFRLPEKTVSQLAALAAKLGMTLTQVVVVAIDRMSEREAGSCPKCGRAGIARRYECECDMAKQEKSK